MSMRTDSHPCPVCGYHDAACSFDDDGPYSLRCPVCRAHLTDPKAIGEEFDPDNFDWIEEQLPEEGGLYIVRRGEEFIIAEYVAHEDGDEWVLPTDRMHNPYYEGEPLTLIHGWADLPKCCHEA